MYLTQGLHRSLQQNPEGIASICAGRVRTFRNCADRVARLAGALQTLGVRSGDRVGCHAFNSDRFGEVYLATFWADAVINPINTRWSGREINYSIDDSGTAALFADESILPKLDEIRAHSDCPHLLIWMGDEPAPAGFLEYEALIDAAKPVEDARRGGDALAGLFYTGGTTGFPKGVMLSHANLVSCALGAAAGGFLTLKPNYLHVAPMFHLADLAAWIVTSFTGGTQVALPGFDPTSFFQAIEQYGITDTVLIPTMIQAAVDASDRDEYDLGTLRRIAYGGSSITEALLRRAKQAWPQVGFCQAYGQTELSPTTALLVPEDHRIESAAKSLLRSGGRAPIHAEIAIFDPEGKPVETGVIGEIVARGPHVMQGYWNKPEETARALPGDGWLRTGDAGYLDEEGYLYIVDRLKDMIISGGENIYSAEVENVVCQHPAVAACAVVGVPDSFWGERVHAVVVLREGQAVMDEDIRLHCKTMLAGYKCPRSVSFASALPVTSTGKVEKRTLRQQFSEDALVAVGSLQDSVADNN